MFLFFALLAHQFGKESFGEFSYYFAIASILFVLFDVGGEFYQIREFTKKESLKIFQNIFILKTIIALSVFLVAFLAEHPIYLLILIGSFYLDSVISLFRSSLYKNALYYQESVLAIIEKSVFIAFVFLNIFTLNDIILMYLAFIIAKACYLLLAIKKFYNLRYLLSSFKLFDLNYFKHYVYNSWSYVLHALLVIIFVQIDIIMLKHMNISYSDIGLYSAAVKIYMVAIVFAEILFKQYYPLITKYVQKGDVSLLKSLILKIQNTNIYFGIYFALFTMLFSPELINLTFGHEFHESSNMLTILALIIIFRFSMYTYTALLSSSNLNYMKIFTSLSCAIANIILNLILIPKYGVYGALIATVITEFILVLFFKISSFKIIFTNYFSIKEFLTLLIGIGSMLSIYIYRPALEVKSMIFIILLISLSINRRNIVKMLTFK